MVAIAITEPNVMLIVTRVAIAGKDKGAIAPSNCCGLARAIARKEKRALAKRFIQITKRL